MPDSYDFFIVRRDGYDKYIFDAGGGSAICGKGVRVVRSRSRPISYDIEVKYNHDIFRKGRTCQEQVK